MGYLIECAIVLAVVIGAFVVGFVEGWALARSQYRDGLRRMYRTARLPVPESLRKWSRPWG